MKIQTQYSVFVCSGDGNGCLSGRHQFQPEGYLIDASDY